MDTPLHFTPSSPLSLRPGAVLTLARPHDGYTRVQVVAGRIWLTQSDDPGDHFLAAGEDWLLCGDGAVVIECDGAETARVQVWHAGERPAGAVSRISPARAAPPVPSASAGRCAAGHTG
ncbi:DUF2917 domain-containing protein [Sphaerotilus sp.]|uniref:DUF2917 domain-containing protein n=1 Tax=Sphaerotilus sp. TaxID=2093942 RepID=UPI002ACD9C55|nr:DUF2917 domain-containing protein [Sphaerotilus sp.]MDZ7857382.1 DUF2917 domain-containing protein [Sphaerotilus sp.]